MNGNVLDMSLETEEFITAEEYMKRRKAGAIDPARVRYAVNPPNGQIGGFYVKLERPRYRVAIPSVKRGPRGPILTTPSSTLYRKSARSLSPPAFSYGANSRG